MKFSVIFAMLIVFVSLIFGVFHIEKTAQSLREELSLLNEEISENKKSIDVLKAEWSYLNQPERLKNISSRLLELDYTSADQIRDVMEIPLNSIIVGSGTNIEEDQGVY